MSMHTYTRSSSASSLLRRPSPMFVRLVRPCTRASASAQRIVSCSAAHRHVRHITAHTAAHTTKVTTTATATATRCTLPLFDPQVSSACTCSTCHVQATQRRVCGCRCRVDMSHTHDLDCSCHMVAARTHVHIHSTHHTRTPTTHRITIMSRTHTSRHISNINININTNINIAITIARLLAASYHHMDRTDTTCRYEQHTSYAHTIGRGCI